jgi:4-hydroxymandelate oxidase
MAGWIDDIGRQAADLLNPTVFEYFRQGAGAETALAEGPAAWATLRLRPRVLRDVSAVSTSTTVLGIPLETPILVAPTAAQHQAHPEAEVATGQGASKAGSLMCVSSSAAFSHQAINETGAPWWAQVYVVRDRSQTRDLLARLRPAGASAVVLTADTPVLGARAVREAELVQALSGDQVTYYGGTPVEPAVLRQADDLTFDDIAWVAAESGLPVLVKGVLRADDARTAVAAGAAGIVVSNHGGRQLNAAVPTARALPRIADALVGTGAEVLVDGGLRSGEHVLAALALGARAVLIGRPVLWALTVGGANGVHQLLSRLTGELRQAMALVGAQDINQLAADLIDVG